MANPMKIRAAVQGDVTDVRVLMAHDMETGLRKDSSGSPIPAHFIQLVTVKHNGKDVFSAQWGTAISKNPFVAFRFKGGKAGDKIQVNWVDNTGDTRTDETTIR